MGAPQCYRGEKRQKKGENHKIQLKRMKIFYIRVRVSVGITIYGKGLRQDSASNCGLLFCQSGGGGTY